jgi:hypothetical protein
MNITKIEIAHRQITCQLCGTNPRFHRVCLTGEDGKTYENQVCDYCKNSILEQNPNARLYHWSYAEKKYVEKHRERECHFCGEESLTRMVSYAGNDAVAICKTCESHFDGVGFYPKEKQK